MKNLFFAAAAAILLAACAPAQIETSTKMSESVFIQPVADDQKSVFVFIKNTSDCDADINQQVRQGLAKLGYTVVSAPDDATFILSAVIKSCGIKDENQMRAEAIGEINPGLGALAAMGTTSSWTEVITGKNMTAQLNADVNIKQKIAGKVQQQTGAQKATAGRIGFSTAQQASNQRTQSYESNYLEYNTAISAQAKRNNLKLKEAMPKLEQLLADKICGLF